MDDSKPAPLFQVSGEAYDSFMGRYSQALADPFADFASVGRVGSALDVGCGPGALTGVLVERLGAQSVAACDPSHTFVEACASRHPGVKVAQGTAERIPFPDDTFDRVLAQLVLHFVSDPIAAASDMRRVVRPGGLIAACVWDFAEGMQLLRAFWDAATVVDPGAPDEAATLKFGGPGEIASLMASVGLVDIEETNLVVSSDYQGFDELWDGLLLGVGPAGAFCISLEDDQRDRLRTALFDRLDAPAGSFRLEATARAAVGRSVR
jgi:SAM-dependent methyltransferase